jgi:flagella basal body P-ring formation protein FlgA
MLTRRAISAGTEIKPTLVEPKEPVILVKRRQMVLLRLETGGLLVSAPGEAMDDGSIGDLIEVRRGQGRDQRTVIGKVMPDGTVEPVI